MSDRHKPERCHHSLCPHSRSAWMWRWRPPKGIRLNEDWYCSAECFERGAENFYSHLRLKADRSRAQRYRLPLGLLLLSKGLISNQHLQEGLKAQRESQAGRLGEWLRQQGIVTEEQLTAALGVQWGLPVFHLAQTAGFEECANMAPLHLMDASHMALVHYMPTSRTLYVAFSDGIDFPALRALEQMLDCSTQPCVIGETEMAEALDALRRMARPSETVLEFPGNPAKLATSTREWVESNDASQVRAVPCSEYLWVRMENASLAGHLLFRLQENKPEAVSIEGSALP